ncbi:hypothetical protein SAMN04490248_10499 [Salinihabitans flavidus]|uniref:Uncharacterized protein n=1 Tax=Salinihabitans flavidus TaxID=569882 RepID=A0A1H8P144_9RHOB|nr:hypothetical protein [Salinihabitans flavidus]SEO35639.1 hypothetical protein SAMN04490248_10499 [Salinihabitans flavidus]
MFRIATVFISAAVAGALSAFPYPNLERLDVNPLPGQGNFEVIAGVRSGPTDIWCAAGDHAGRKLGAGSNDRIYITQGYGPSRTKPGFRGVSFTISPDESLRDGPRLGEGGNYSVSMRTVGFNISVSLAEQYCRTSPDIL